MENKKFKPLFDKLFWWTLIPTAIIMIAMTVVSAFAPITLLITTPIDLFVAYFLASPVFGYVELRENGVYIKFGFIMKRYIPYEKIRAIEKKHQFYSDSMLALKGALDHVNIKYNKFDIVSVSVKDGDGLASELAERAGICPI
jgi:hypothetical protein